MASERLDSVARIVMESGSGRESEREGSLGALISRGRLGTASPHTVEATDSHKGALRRRAVELSTRLPYWTRTIPREA